MKSYFANILDRHLGADSLVKPRLRARFETEDLGSAEPMPINRFDMAETKEVPKDSESRILDNHSAVSTTDPIESQRVEPEAGMSSTPSEPVGLRDDHVQRRDDGIRSTADDAISVDEDANSVEPRNETPSSQPQSLKPLLAEPNQPTQPEEKLSGGRSKPVDPGDDHRGRRDDLTQPTNSYSDSVDAKPAEIEFYEDKPPSHPQYRQPIADRTGEQTRSLVRDTLSLENNRYPASETEKEPARTADLPESVAIANLTAKADAQPMETGLSFDRELDNRINSMLARLQDDQNKHLIEPAETNILNRLMDTKPGHAGENEKEQAAPSLIAAHAFDESKRESLPDVDQEQQIVDAPDNRDRSRDGLLSPPAWLSEVQTEINRQKNETKGECETEPVINVTIGRVEVRAVQEGPPQRVRRKKKPSGVMSLDEYLNQRERRG